MKIKLYIVALLILLVGLSGCSKKPVMADRVLVKNASAFKVTDVKLRHIPTNRIGSVSAILPNESLDIGFPKQPLLADRAIIRWVDGQSHGRSDELDIPYDAAVAESGKPMSLIYILHPSGSVTAHLQDSLLLSY